MEKKLIVSLHDGIAVISQQNGGLCHAPFDGAGALCAGDAGVFCADNGGALWRLDPETLMPQTLGCGGPGICDLKLSACGTRLYALLGEADCVLMSDAYTGSPIALNRCGCNPRGMACSGDLLAVAGGESGCVHLFHPHTLEGIGAIRMPGPVCSVALYGNCICALCQTAQLDTLLAVWKERRLAVSALPGMPGCLFGGGERLYAAVQGMLYMYSITTGELIAKCLAPGRASRVMGDHTRLFLYDPLSECVFASVHSGRWRRICSGVRDICLV